jgi:hypothetical protein
MAMARPPRVMVLIDRPKYLNTSTVMKIDTGMAVSAISVGARCAQEEVQDHRDEHRGADQLALQRVDGRLDEAGLAEGDTGLAHARGQPLLQFIQRGLDGAGEPDGVGRGLLLDAQDHGRAAVRSRRRRA